MSTATSTSHIGTRIANRLNEKLGPKRFAMWFDRSARFELDDREQALRITVANKFLADGIGRQFHEQVRQAARDELGHDVRLDLGVRPAPIDKDTPDTHPHGKPSHNPRADRHNASPSINRKSARRWRYTLEDFVVGPSNQLAFAAATRMAEHDDDPAATPGASAGSPLFIHGTCGLGKTHLLQGICHRYTKRRPDAKVRYTTGEQFTNDYITAVRTNSLDAFRKKIRRLDLLAVDDVHFLANKEKTQQEFLHCFNEIELSGARVIMVSDCHPKLIRQFSDALASRCVRGMVVRIDPPDDDTRLRLVEALTERRGLAVPQSVAKTIADRCSGSVRDIEGVLYKLQALSMIHRPATAPGFPGGHGISGGRSTSGAALRAAPVIGHSLLDLIFQDQPASTPRKPVRFNTILDAVCQMFALPPEQVTGRMRKTHIVLARSLLIHLAYDLTHMSYPEIAAAMGRPNHSTIITAAKRIKQQLNQDNPLLLPGQPAETTPTQLLTQLRQTITRRNNAAD